MLKRLLPKEEKYFEHFNDMITQIGEMAKLTHQLFSGDVYDPGLILQIKPMEKRCDEILIKIVKQLNKSFITPFDREDIFALISQLDDISDTLLGSCIRLEIFKVSEKIKGADKLTAVVALQIKSLDKAIRGLRDNTDNLNECKTVKDLEAEADVIYQSLTTKLFEEEKDAIELMKKKEILEILENASDKCQAVANVITSIVIKNA
jgi:uncharacterized protein